MGNFLACWRRTSLQTCACWTLNTKVAGSGRQPIHLAAEGGHCDVIKVLLDAGGSPKSADEAGYTPYQLAADNGHDAAAKVSANSTRAIIDFSIAWKGIRAGGSLASPLLAAAVRDKNVWGQCGFEPVVAGLWPCF